MIPQRATRLVNSESVREHTRIDAITAEAIWAFIGVRYVGWSFARLGKSAPSRAMAKYMRGKTMMQPLSELKMARIMAAPTTIMPAGPKSSFAAAVPR